MKSASASGVRTELATWAAARIAITAIRANAVVATRSAAMQTRE